MGRVRIYAQENNSAWDNQDRKKWMGGARKHATEEEAVEFFRSFIEMIRLAYKTCSGMELPEVDYILIQGGPDKFMHLIEHGKIPWMHVKKEKI